jgi:hypothetical protein
MQLSEQQIDQLFQFCEKRRVFHYDLQVEIVDHLANAIEERMQADPRLGFSDALDLVHRSFGPLGLRSMTSSREQALEKRYNQMRWQLFKSYFTWPKFAFTFLLIMIVTALPQFLDGNALAWAVIVLGVITVGYILRFQWQAHRFRKQQTRKLLMTTHSHLYFSPVFLSLGMQVMNGLIKYGELAITSQAIELFQYYSCSILFIGYIIVTRVREEMLAIVDQKARREYPLAFAG